MADTEAKSMPGPRRRGLGRALAEVHYRLRTEGDTPGRKALAVALGTFIGCIPLYGTHAALCAVIAGLFGLNRLVTYLAAHINNPITAPLLLAVSFKVGHRVQYGIWPSLRPGALAEIGLWNIGTDLLLGGVLVGLVLAPVAGIVAWIVGRRARRPERWTRIIDDASRRYLESGVRHWEFVRGKMRHDPVYFMLHDHLEGTGGTILDLGCGRGIALALLDATRNERGAAGTIAPRKLLGVDCNPKVTRVARAALGENASIEERDLADFQPPAADVVLLLDVLHYLDAAVQEQVLDRACHSLRPGGLLFMREPDAASGVKFFVTRTAERTMSILRGRLRQRFHYRSGAEWHALLRGHGLTVAASGAAQGTPFANVLIEGRAPAVSGLARLARR